MILRTSTTVSSLILYRDRMFAVCLTLSWGIFLFFLIILLPIADKYHHVGYHSRDLVDSHGLPMPCSLHDADCITPLSLIAVLFAYVVPMLVMTINQHTVQHRLAFMNTWVELGSVMSFVFLYFLLTFSLSISNDSWWPFLVRLHMNRWAAFFITLTCLTVALVSLYFLLRFTTLRVWRQPHQHYTENLLTAFEQAYEQLNDVDPQRPKSRQASRADRSSSIEPSGSVIHELSVSQSTSNSSLMLL